MVLLVLLLFTVGQTLFFLWRNFCFKSWVNKIGEESLEFFFSCRDQILRREREGGEEG